MDTSVQTAEIISRTFTRANAEVPGFSAEASPELPLFDVPGAVLDSLNLITFVFILEEEFALITGKKLKVTTEDVLATHAPFRNVSALRDYISGKIHVL